MRRITLWLMSTIAAVVLLFSYRTSTDSGAAATPGTAAAGTATAGTAAAGTATPSAASGGNAPTSGGATTYKGSTAQTRWGPVQVSITVTNGKITSVAVPTYPTGNGKDKEINAYALPVLKQETITAQSANVDTVSGATVTSNGYKASLQAALDAAHL